MEGIRGRCNETRSLDRSRMAMGTLRRGLCDKAKRCVVVAMDCIAYTIGARCGLSDSVLPSHVPRGSGDSQ